MGPLWDKSYVNGIKNETAHHSRSFGERTMGWSRGTTSPPFPWICVILGAGKTRGLELEHDEITRGKENYPVQILAIATWQNFQCSGYVFTDLVLKVIFFANTRKDSD